MRPNRGRGRRHAPTGRGGFGRCSPLLLARRFRGHRRRCELVFWAGVGDVPDMGRCCISELLHTILVDVEAQNECAAIGRVSATASLSPLRRSLMTVKGTSRMLRAARWATKTATRRRFHRQQRQGQPGRSGQPHRARSPQERRPCTQKTHAFRRGR